MSDLRPIINDPTLGYRLDPYEPGLLRQSKASRSTSQVVAHEHRNMTRLTRKAIQEGRVIINKQITYRPVIAGSYMGTAAGKTTVVSLEKQTPLSDAAFEPSEDNKKWSSTPLNENTDEGTAIDPQSEQEQKTPEELNQEELDLKGEIRKLTNELDESNKEDPKSSVENPINRSENRLGQLKRELEEKKEELRKIRFQKMEKAQEELLGSLNEGLLRANESPMNIIDTLYNGKGNEDSYPGGQIDLTV